MRLFLHKVAIFVLPFLFVFSFVDGYSQTYTITGNVNASTLSCSTFTGYSSISIGDGSTTTNLTMNADLDLTTCSLGPLQIIINNAKIDFSTANKRLYLPEGSSLTFINGGILYPSGGTGGGCTGNDRLYIGSLLLATCQGGAGVLGFDELIDLGGTGSATSNSPVCAGSSINLFATPPSNGTFNYSWTGPGLSATAYSSSPNYSFTATTTPVTGGVYTVSMKRSSDNKIITANVTVTVNALPVITTQPTNQLDCDGSFVNFKVVASGTGLTYTWQRKKPTDVSFITIPSGDANTTFLSPDEIRLGNVGSAQYPDGTQFQVIVSNSNCSVTSNTVTLSVNEITDLTPSTTNLTQCYSTNYTYTVSTSYPANVVSYQWKKSVVSGTWTSISNGGVYSGATTASLTITGGTPTESAEYRVYITFNNSTTQCSVDSSTRTRNITFLPQLTTPQTTVTQPTCSTITGTITVTVQSASDTYSFDNGSNFQSSNVKSGLASGSYNVIIKNIGGCSSNINTTVINPQPTTPSAPIVGTITQPNCTLDTGSVLLSGLPSGTWTLVRSGTSSDTTTGTGTSTTITGLTDGGSYTFTVSNGTCTSAASSSVNIDAISTMTSTWNGSVWINGTPDNSKRIVFAGDYSSTSDLTGCSCKVTSGANVIINSTHTLTVTNDVKVLGTLTFENNASLVQIEDAAVNSGNINYKRYTSAVRRYDFTYWSSPVEGQTLYNLSPNTLYDKYYSYNADTGWVIHYNGNVVMEAAKGYIIRAPQTFSITVASIDTNPKFIGVPNNGIKTMTLGGNKNYLIGNPYPSAIDADQFLSYNSGILEGTLYFWTHNSSPSTAVAGDAIYNYTSNDYATYNLTGGVVTAKPALTGGTTPTGKIAAGQGFFAPASIAGGTLVFNNNMRISGGASGVNNSNFYKLSNTSKLNTTTAIDKNRIWLNLYNQQGAFKQTLAGYITGATNDYDNGYDGETYNGNTFVDFYSVNNAKKLTIQGRVLPFVETDEVPLGYKTTIAGDFSIAIDQKDGLFTSQNIFIEDKLLNVIHDLKDSPYKFTTQIGTFDSRFVLRYVNKSAIIDTTNVAINGVLVSNTNSEIKITSSNGSIDDVYIYDLSGTLIYQSTKIASNETTIKNLLMGTYSALIVKVVLESGETVNTKIIY